VLLSTLLYLTLCFSFFLVLVCVFGIFFMHFILWWISFSFHFWVFGTKKNNNKTKTITFYIRAGFGGRFVCGG